MWCETGVSQAVQGEGEGSAPGDLRRGDSCGGTGGGDGEAEPCLRERGLSPDAGHGAQSVGGGNPLHHASVLKSFHDHGGHQSFAEELSKGQGQLLLMAQDSLEKPVSVDDMAWLR